MGNNSYQIEYAGFILRLYAFIIDLIVFIAIVLFVKHIFGINTDKLLLLRILSLTIALFYFAFQECSSKQATLGKRAIGIIVTDLQGHRISFWRAIGRFGGRILSTFFLIGYLITPFTAKKQALHDITANCLVIKKNPKIDDNTAADLLALIISGFIVVFIFYLSVKY